MDFPRPFLLHQEDGTVWQGAQFLTGRCVAFPTDADAPHWTLAADVDALLTDGARIEWANATAEG